MASLKLSSAEGTHWPNLQTILMIEKSSVHDHTNVDFCKRMGVCWVEVANETVSLARSREGDLSGFGSFSGTSHQERAWGYKEFP